MHVLMTALQPGGGIRTFLRYIYSQPCFEGCTITLLAPDDGLSDYLSEYVPAGRLKVVPAPTHPVKFLVFVRKMLKSQRFDLVHSHGFSAGTLTQIACTGSAVPHLMTAHDVFLKAQFSGLKGKLRRKGMAFAFRRITAIHTVTRDAGNNLQEFFPEIKAGRIANILHGVDSCYFRDGASRNLKQEIDLPEATPLIGFFGRFMGQKGFKLLVDAIGELAETGAVQPVPHVATFGWGGFIREDYAYLQEKGLGDYFHQFSQTNDMAAAIKGVDLVAMPSRWEACGLLAMEVLSAGVPIIGANCIGLREVLSGSPARMITVGSSDELANAISDEIARQPSRTGEFKSYQSEAVSRFNIDRPAKALHSLYMSLCSPEFTKGK
jgi:glycosyltransferase involved in cell wall biosynthesis